MPTKSKQKNTSAPRLGGYSTRPNARYRVSGGKNGATVTGTQVTPVFTTGLDGSATSAITINPGFYASYVKNVALNYQMYRVRKIALEYVPLVGATVGGAVRTSVLDNPETVYKLSTGSYSLADINLLVFSSSRTKTHNMWNPHVYSVPQQFLTRRKSYSIDSTSLGSAEHADRTTPAVFLITMEGPANATIGYFVLHFTFEFMSFAAATSVPLLFTTRQFLGEAGEWWEETDGVLRRIPPPSTP